MDKVSEYVRRFGINDNLPKFLSMSLGASDTRLINMVAGYGMIVNGGKKIEPYFIEQVQDRRGNTILKHDKRECPGCNVDFYENGVDKKAYEIVNEGLDVASKNENDFVIVDTAGRLQTNVELMEELVEIKKIYNPDEILLVVDAMAGQDIINVAQEFNKYLKLTGLIITKLDSDARAGATLSLTSLIKVPIKFTGIGEKIGSLDIFYPDRMADRILGLGDIMTLAEKAADVYDEKQARNAMQRMLSGKMDLEDLLKQMEQLNKMGSLSGLMKMMPTKLNDKISENKVNEMEEKMKVWKILLSSMTLKERRNPKLFKKFPSRKLRVVKGSGRNMDELNKLLKQWETARDKMAEAGKMLQSGKNPFGKNGFNMF